MGAVSPVTVSHCPESPTCRTDCVKLLPRLLLPLAVALAYALSGWLSLRVAIPPNYVSLVFIPAGIALGATLVFGLISLPGIVLGTVAVQWLASDQAGVSTLQWTLLVSPVGAALQAWQRVT